MDSVLKEHHWKKSINDLAINLKYCITVAVFYYCKPLIYRNTVYLYLKNGEKYFVYSSLGCKRPVKGLYMKL